MWLWERKPISKRWNKNTSKMCLEWSMVYQDNLSTCTVLHVTFVKNSQSVPRYKLCPFFLLLPYTITRWPLVYLATRRQWSPTPCLQESSRASFTASALLVEERGKLSSSRNWSSTSDGLSPTTLSCSVACSKSESGRTMSASGWLNWYL